VFRAQVRILRHLKLVVAIAVAAMLAWSVAPALSLTPYRPEAVDFEQRVPAVERVAGGAAGARTAGSEHHGHGEGPVRFRSPVIDAPARFGCSSTGRALMAAIGRIGSRPTAAIPCTSAAPTSSRSAAAASGPGANCTT
jgi:hypothetical protein